MGKDNHPRERQKNKLERKKAKLDPYSRILIVCEGTKTEPQYFKEIQQFHKLHSANIQIMPSEYGTSPVQVVQYAYDIFINGDPHRKIEKKAFEKVFAIFDRDDHEKYHEALEMAQAFNKKMGRQVEFRAIASVPCFELWLLLHFEDIQSPLHRNEVEKKLKKYITDYTKGKQGIFEITKENLPLAIQRAKQLASLSTEHNGENPFTAVAELVELLNSLKHI